ncbi:MAG: Asp-tRNA(Asn)/Glu-tRNA(Gln) amidotransferase subunit GatC [Clostridiales Family XIII bacterium]|jgi:aspartyl-tRNA(Asn)/glutamyl-tRNA(Gln) amidotransferase subunit C|nr:Asp-tRNA(Asn)/Glu-tRNA(Gln) amidotransferase subunit GatC [Clostridiales Family XIII bacterium]
MKITEELVDYVADLSRITLDRDEKVARGKDLGDILDYMDKLNELDTSGLPEMTHPFESENRFREDAVTNADRREEMLANAPESKGDFFRVFKTVEE